MSYNLYLTNPPFPLPSCPSILPESSTLSPYRPEVVQLVRQALPTGDFGGLGVESDKALESTPGGGLAVVAAGPEGLVMEARNAVASISVTARVAAGGIGFHDEVYAL
jgi:ferric-chelate reductase